MRRQGCLDQPAFRTVLAEAGFVIVHRRHNAVNTQQVGNRLSITGKHQPITATQPFFRRGRSNYAATPLDLHQVQPLQFPQAGFANGFPHQRAVQGHSHFQRELPHGPKLLLVFAVRQHPRHQQQHHSQASDRDRQTHRSDREYRESGFTCQLLVLPVDHQVSTGADQRQGAPQNGRVT